MNRIADRLAVSTALLGGAVLVALVVMTCVSVVGRALTPLGFGPVPGDYELVEAGIAFAVFCFLPMCQLRAGHATVDLFTSRLGQQPNRVLVAFWETVFAAALVLLALRLFSGFQGKLANGETTMFLQFPVWWAYGASLLPAGVAALVGIWSAWDRWRAALTGRESRALGPEEMH